MIAFSVLNVYQPAPCNNQLYFEQTPIIHSSSVTLSMPFLSTMVQEYSQSNPAIYRMAANECHTLSNA